MSNHQIDDLSAKTPRMVGREGEIKRLKACLKARGEKHFIYYWARGGLGKTRLLEELLQLVREAGPGYHTTGIIDLYHTDTHSTSDLERTIVESLDPGHKYFKRYTQERAQYELLREKGTDPNVLERRRVQLSQIFVQECREMALDARKLVICLDTVEVLQYESSVVEEAAGLDTVDARVKSWLLTHLAQLANVLVVFAGRPKEHAPEDLLDPQARLVADLQKVFGRDLAIVELQPFTLDETRDFFKALVGETEVIPARYLPVVHRLTGGRPVFLHLILDLMQRLAPPPRDVLRMFDQYMDLVEGADDERLVEARLAIEKTILRGVINAEAELGEYLQRLALMPKGVDVEILQEVLGVPGAEAQGLLDRLKPLSFVKHYQALPGATRLHGERTFLHDEMYRLLTRPDVMPSLRINEREKAHALITNFYAPHIAQLEREIAQQPASERLPLRERLQKLQVESLYYRLVCDPIQGYAEYRRLSDLANRSRWVGFGMRLLDEFLRFYNTPERRKQFEVAGITREQVIREGAEMWVERFFWWGQYERASRLARRILDAPESLHFRCQEDVALLANVCALWVRAEALQHGYQPAAVQEAVALLARLPALNGAGLRESLALARLHTSIGYQYRLGGLLQMAAGHYAEANAAFKKLGDRPDEHAMLINNLAFVYAQEGRMALARPLAHEALRMTERLGSDYSTGLILSALASIARMRGNYQQAEKYGEEALAIFRDLSDPHGIARASLALAQARRRSAKHELEKDRRLQEPRETLEEAQRFLGDALARATEAGLSSDALLLQAELGRIARDLGRVISRLENSQHGLQQYRQAERLMRQTLTVPGWGPVDRADALQDLAEVLFLSGDPTSAAECLVQAENLIGTDYLIIPGKHVPRTDLAPERFWPLGKVEMLRGQMAFAHNERDAGLQHFILAYAYFVSFSSEAVEVDTLLEYLYNHMRDLPVDSQRDLLAAGRAWSQDSALDAKVNSFLDQAKDLLGV